MLCAFLLKKKSCIIALYVIITLNHRTSRCVVIIIYVRHANGRRRSFFRYSGGGTCARF